MAGERGSSMTYVADPRVDASALYPVFPPHQAAEQALA